MLELIRLQKDIEDWVYDFVSVYNETLNTVPCPFAKHAIMNDRIIWKIATTEYELEKICTDYTDQELWLHKEVLIIGINPKHIHKNDFINEVERLNKEVLQPVGLVALEDHPDKVERVGGIKMNQGSWALVLIQSAEKLRNASEILRKQGYYDVWTKEQLDDVVNWR